MKGQNNRLIKHYYVFCNVTCTNKQSAISLSIFFNRRAIAKGDNNVNGVYVPLSGHDDVAPLNDVFNDAESTQKSKTTS